MAAPPTTHIVQEILDPSSGRNGVVCVFILHSAARNNYSIHSQSPQARAIRTG